MSNKVELLDEELDAIEGGKITYTWNGTIGTIGINGNNPYILLDKDAFGAYYTEVKETMGETKILKNLRKMGIIKAPNEV